VHPPYKKNKKIRTANRLAPGLKDGVSKGAAATKDENGKNKQRLQDHG